MPKLFSVNHNSYIIHFINEASYNSGENGGTYFKISLRFDKLLFSIVALIKPDKMDDCDYIVLSNNGDIHGMTKNIK